MTKPNGPEGHDENRTVTEIDAMSKRDGHWSTIIGSGTDSNLPPRDVPPLLTVGGRLDTYELLEQLGEGGMGMVWKARHLKLHKLVALKVLPQQLTTDAETVRRFEQEMRAVAAVDHPNVVRAMDAGESGGLHFLVMEYVEGVDLSKHVATRGPLSVTSACIAARHAALGLAAAHAQGLVHRDIKPSNLLLSKLGTVKILDLGLARLRADGTEARRLTRTGQVFGTPDFMAPEQWDDSHKVNQPADLYSLGCTLCFLLTGRAPFADEQHRSMGQIMKAHLLEAPPRLRDLRADIPQELDDLYLQLMIKEPADRKITAAELATRLKEIVLSMNSKKSLAAAPDRIVVPEPMHVPESPFPAVSQPMGNPVRTPGTEAETAGAANAAPAPVESRSAEETRSSKADSRTASPVRPRAGEVPGPAQRRKPMTSMAVAGGVVALVLVAGIAFKMFNSGQTTTELDEPGPSPGEVVPDIAPSPNTDVSKQDTASKPTAPSSPVVPPPPFLERPPVPAPMGPAPAPAMAPFPLHKARDLQRVWAAYLGVPVEFENSIHMKFRLIPPGEFSMGMTKAEAEKIAASSPRDEHWQEISLGSAPPHRVRLTHACYLGVYEVTQQQFEQVMGRNPSSFSAQGPGKNKVEGQDTQRHPVESVSYYDAIEFCEKLSTREKLKPVYSRNDTTVTRLLGDGYRLPTEAEWEFACRAGTMLPWHAGADEMALQNASWLRANSDGMTHPVGQKASNGFGLCDMHGNVLEWCQDYFDSKAYSRRGPTATIDPRGPESGDTCVLRGGSWKEVGDSQRAAFRTSNNLVGKTDEIGFRVLLEIDVPTAGR